MMAGQMSGGARKPEPLEKPVAAKRKARGDANPLRRRGRSLPLSDDEQIRALGFEPTRQGLIPLTTELDETLAAAAARTGPGSFEGYVPFRIPGEPVECCVCKGSAEPSTAGTPTCSAICAGVLMHNLNPALADALYTKADGSGGRHPRRPITPPGPPKRLSVVPRGSVSVERALERLVDCKSVLGRHGVDVRWGRTARCPFHDDHHPSMSLYERNGRSRAHCFPCCFDGDALDLEAALAGEDLTTTIRRWGSQ